MKKITLLITLFVAATTMMWSQNTHIVTSGADSGDGSLRDIISAAASNDSIVIQSDITEIVLSDVISAGKSIKINGQGCTLKVSNPGVSTYRVLSFPMSSSANGNIALYNLTLAGGDISGNGNSESGKGGALFTKNANLKLINCTITSGKAYTGGGFANTASAHNLVIKDCYFSGNIGTSGHNAVSLNFTDGILLENTVFENNGDLNFAGSTVEMAQAGTISNCVFKNNTSKGGRGGAALATRNGAGTTITLESCLFDGNTNKGSDGGTGISAVGVGTLSVTNCTFYNNAGPRAAFYHYSGASVIVNSTFAANKASQAADYGGGIFTTGSGSITLVNNILAYNYNNNSAEVAKDAYFGGSVTISGTNNLIAAGTSPGALTNPISYDSSIDDLFANYTTNSESNTIPSLDASTGSIILKDLTSVAIKAGVTTFDGATIPTTDQRGEERLTPPCLGSYEWQSTLTNIIDGVLINDFKYWSSNGNLSVISDIMQNVKLYSIDGRLISTLQLNEGKNTFYGLSKGLYLLNGKKIIIK